jgi:hypothetical protein
VNMLSREQPIRGGPPAWGGLGGGLTTPHRKRSSLLRNVTQGLRLGRILLNDLGNGKWIQNFYRET